MNLKDDALPRPITCRIGLKELAHGLEFSAAPLHKALKAAALFLTGLLWFGLSLPGLYLVMFSSNPKYANESPVVISSFVAFGVLLMCAAIQLWTENTVLIAQRERLTNRRGGKFWKRERSVAASEIRDIRFETIGSANDENPRFEHRVNVFTSGGGKMGVLSNADDDELRWVVSVLRRYYGLSPASETDFSATESYRARFGG